MTLVLFGNKSQQNHPNMHVSFFLDRIFLSTNSLRRVPPVQRCAFFQIVMSEERGTAGDVPSGTYRFQALEKRFESIEGKQNRDFLIKWYVSTALPMSDILEYLLRRGMRGKMKAFMYIFDQPFQEYNVRKFILVNTDSILMSVTR